MASRLARSFLVLYHCHLGGAMWGRVRRSYNDDSDVVILMIFPCRLSYVIPSSVVHGIKQVHPMFSGYTQQVGLKAAMS